MLIDEIAPYIGTGDLFGQSGWHPTLRPSTDKVDNQLTMETISAPTGRLAINSDYLTRYNVEMSLNPCHETSLKLRII